MIYFYRILCVQTNEKKNNNEISYACVFYGSKCLIRLNCQSNDAEMTISVTETKLYCMFQLD